MADNSNRKKSRPRRLIYFLLILLAVGTALLCSRRMRAMLLGKIGMQTRSVKRVWVEPDVTSQWEQLVAETLDEALARV